MSGTKPITSEEDIIRDFLRKLADGCDAALNLEDDAACLTPEPGTDFVITSDALVAGVHFRVDDNPEDIGFKAAAVNVSDLVAKGAEATAFTLSLALPKDPSRAWLDGFTRGFGAWVSGKLIGGDLVYTPGPVTLSVTAIGTVPTGRMVHRTTARAGNAVYVTGTIGGSAIGLRCLQNEPPQGLADRDRADVIRDYLRPVPPVELVSIIRTHATAAMDLSDGLVRDATRMCVGSGVGMAIDAGIVPIRSAVRALVDTGDVDIRDLLTGGDDYQVLMTVPEDRVPAFEKVAKAASDTPVTRIGTVTGKPGELIVQDADGNPMMFETTGHDHF